MNIGTALSLLRATWRASQEKLQGFKFENDETFLSSWFVPLLAVPIYLIMIYGTQWWIRNIRKRPFDLRWLVILHNAALSIASGVLWLLLLSAISHIYFKRGFLDLLCDPNQLNTSGPHVFYYYVNYLLKYVELFDTVLLALRDKPMMFLHVYHHAATLVLTWVHLRANTCVQWLPIFLNLLVHVAMYAYYTLNALKIDVWWKRFLTQAQISQFIVVLVMSMPPFSFRISHDLGLASSPRCTGTYEATFFGIGIIASYLLLFMRLYGDTYKAKSQRKASRAVEKEVHLNGADAKTLDASKLPGAASDAAQHLNGLKNGSMAPNVVSSSSVSNGSNGYRRADAQLRNRVRRPPAEVNCLL